MFSLYKLILEWAIDNNNIMVWHWTQAQWTFMARSASIDSLHTDNFKLGPDSLIAKYDDSKTDKNAEYCQRRTFMQILLNGDCVIGQG